MDLGVVDMSSGPWGVFRCGNEGLARVREGGKRHSKGLQSRRLNQTLI